MGCIGAIVGIIALILAWVFFGWKLVLVLVLVTWGNNMELTSRKK